ncbi:MAG: PIN domain-containing protein [Luteolibacter sp.]
MTPLLVDTNVLLRFITGEPADQADQVTHLFEAADGGKVRLAVLPMVLAEAVFVLTGFYQHPRSKTAEVLAHLISCPGFHSSEQQNMLHALKLFGASKLDFVDCYLAAASIRDGRPVVSFDRDFAKLHGVILRKPGDPL